MDNKNRLRSLDKGGMLKVLMAYPEHCKRAIKIAEETPLNIEKEKAFSEIVFAGIGGSAIGGQLICDWLRGESTTPMVVSRGYTLPGFVDEDTLVFVISYSGNTEETIGTFNQAIGRKCRIISFTSGGVLEQISEKKGIPVVRMPRGFRSRMTLPYQLLTIATVLRRFGVIEDSWEEVQEAFDVLDKIKEEVAPSVPMKDNFAKKAASDLVGRIPFIFGPQLFEGVAYRFGTQLNENSKVPSCSGYYPEIFHNIILGSEGPLDILSSLALVMIRDPDDAGDLASKTEFFKALFTKRVGKIVEIKARGMGRLARMLSVIYIGDFVSVYLGLLYGCDPSSQNAIDELKRI